MNNLTVKIMKTKALNLFAIAMICITGFTSCSKDDCCSAEDDDPKTTGIMGFEKWENEQKQLDIDFILKDNVIASFNSDFAGRTYTFSHNGTKVTEIAFTYSQDGTDITKTLTVTYDGDKMTGITGGSRNYEFEFDTNDAKRIEQINSTNRFYEFTYTGDNITTIEETIGASEHTYTITYDDKENPFYNHMNIRAFTTSDEVYGMSPHNWALGYLLTLTKNNPTKITDTRGNVYQNTYNRTGDRLDNVVQDWTLQNETVITTKYVLIY